MTDEQIERALEFLSDKEQYKQYKYVFMLNYQVKSLPEYFNYALAYINRLKAEKATLIKRS